MTTENLAISIREKLLVKNELLITKINIQNELIGLYRTERERSDVLTQKIDVCYSLLSSVNCRINDINESIFNHGVKNTKCLPSK